jgi:hypothetical protein
MAAVEPTHAAAPVSGVSEVSGFRLPIKIAYERYPLRQYPLDPLKNH